MKLRVILLEKIASMEKDCFCKNNNILPKNAIGPWITLGHFDATYTYELNVRDADIFMGIKKSNQTISAYNSGESYFHPLYVLYEDNDEEFWRSQTWYLAVVRIHYALSTDIAMLNSCLKNALMDDAKKHNCTCHIYQTIELSDLALAVKSNCLRDILDFTLKLRKYSCIGKVYTYCSISYDRIRSTSDFPEFETIPTFSMRFSVSDFQEVTQQIATLKRTLGDAVSYSIVGVDDISLNCTGLPMGNLIRLYRCCFIPDYDCSSPLSKAFSDVTTRVGIDLGEQFPFVEIGRNSNNGTRLSEACQRLVRIDSEIQAIVHDSKYDIPYETVHSWLKPLSELTKSLLRMSRTVVLDEFVYLMIPGVTAFLENILCLLQNTHKLPEEYAPYYQRFVENWSHLMEHIMRIEGQLTHYPDVRPIIYDIPIVMLEYTLAFLEQVSDVLRSSDADPQRINFLLVPCLCNRMNAIELFAAGRNIPGLVLIAIPFHTLYNPAEVLCALVHETSHFVGETHRNRESRASYFIKAIAVLMAKVFFSSYAACIIETIAKELEELLDLQSRTSAQKIRDFVKKWALNLFKEKNYNKFVRKVLLLNSGREKVKFETSPAKIRDIRLLKFGNLLQDLYTLFREIYADICMLYFLPLETTSYVNSLVDDLVLNGDNPYEQFAIRIYISLAVSRRSIPEKTYFASSDAASHLYEEIKKIQSELVQDEEPERLFPISSIRYLIEYAQECYKSLDSSLAGKSSLEDIKNMFNGVVHEMNYDKLLEPISTYRMKVID